MGTIKSFLSILLLSSISLSIYGNPQKPELTVLRSVIHNFIVPAHNQLEQGILRLDNVIVEYCQQPSDSSLRQARDAWKLAMTSWTRLSPINFGPIDESNAAWRFQFWPDDINLVHRKLNSRINGSNPKISSEDLANASVAIQGLSALEYLLFDEQVGTLQQYQSKQHLCHILQGTSHNLLRNAQQLNTLWKTDFPERWLSPEHSAKNSDYLNYNLESLFSGLVMAVDLFKSKKLGSPLGIKKSYKERGKLNPWQLESWRSNTSLNQIRTGLKICKQLYEMEKGLSWYLNQRSPQSNYIDGVIRQQYKETITLVDSFNVSAFQLIQKNQVTDLEMLYIHIAQLHDLLKFDYAQAARIQFRFNAHDGD